MIAAALFLPALAAGLSACSASGAPASAAAGTATTSASAAPPASPAASGSGQADIAENVTMPGSVRHQLVAVAAAAKHVPARDFVGLDPHARYYAYDDTTATYWAAAALVPRPSSAAAATSVQDNGSFDLFEKPNGGRWRVFEVGQAGTGGTQCPVEVPGAVAARWGWTGPGCRPPHGS